MKNKIIIVDDEPQVIDSIKRCLRKVDAEFFTFDSPIKVIEKVAEIQPNLIITDQRMPFMSGTEMIEKIRQDYNKFDAILVSAFNDFNDVANAFNQGDIQQYIAKPWDKEELRRTVQSSLASVRDGLRSEVVTNKPDTPGFHGIISAHESMVKVFNYLKKASSANIPVFITGETGTGKELAAKAFHQEGMRRTSPFVAVNCANFSDSLMESQLFGHVKGAFTGAIRSQKGLLETAGDGVIFLDEITCLPLDLQAKLLRVLQEREFSPIGSHSPQKFLAQIVSASSTPLRQAVELGEFREDLFYRLNVVTVELPPLRARGDDVITLADHFLQRFCKELNKEKLTFSSSAHQKMKRYHWPGNIRQLENLIHSLVVLTEGTTIDSELIDLDFKFPENSILDGNTNIGEDARNSGEIHLDGLTQPGSNEIVPLWKTEKKAIENAINAFEGNV
ncbi:MAG: sigma-54 dependent transcriptional regulator, partial [Kangiellaceae bacterium]|nr:sigma-54 dependent transcriptional regulator [Kangiellaceae bacterium]